MAKKMKVSEKIAEKFAEVKEAVMPPKVDSTETALIRDLVSIIKTIAPDITYSAVLRAESYLAKK
jgi:hypothetical protein